MMLKSWKLIVLSGLLLSASTGLASAVGTSEPDPYVYRDGTRIDKIGKKFGRGLTNVLRLASMITKKTKLRDDDVRDAGLELGGEAAEP